jgi:hypothetical protein
MYVEETQLLQLRRGWRRSSEPQPSQKKMRHGEG